MNTRKSFEEVAQAHLEMSLKTFEKSTSLSSMFKLEEEMNEVTYLLSKMNKDAQRDKLKEEYADCFMCLIDSAAREGISMRHITEAIAAKIELNKERKWALNEDLTYSHIK